MDLLEAKKQFGNLYQVEFADKTSVVFRLLIWKEYEHYHYLYSQNRLDQTDESLFNLCLVELRSPLPIDKLRAGVIYTITNIIFSLSGPKSIDSWQSALEDARKYEVVSLYSQIEMMICKAFPAYKPEDIWDMGWPTIMNRLAQAEVILLQTREIEKPLKFATSTPATNKKELVEELLKDANLIKQIDKYRPVGQKHRIGRESNLKKVRD